MNSQYKEFGFYCFEQIMSSEILVGVAEQIYLEKIDQLLADQMLHRSGEPTFRWKKVYAIDGSKVAICGAVVAVHEAQHDR